jgi:tRNA A-37 threonylcarbamoyl transferase component Bud32
MNYPEIHKSYIRSWQFARDDFSPLLEKLLSGTLPEYKVIYHTRHKECRLISGQEISPVVFKLYREKRFFRYLFRPSQAYREFMGFKLTSDAGIPVAEVVALGEKRSFLYLKEAFFVTEYLTGFQDGDIFTRAGCDEMQKDRFIRINLSYLARLHNAGLVHGGFHPRNELFKLDENGDMSVVWIDLATVAPEGRNRRFSCKGDVNCFLREFALDPEKDADYRAYYASLCCK